MHMGFEWNEANADLGFLKVTTGQEMIDGRNQRTAKWQPSLNDRLL